MQQYLNKTFTLRLAFLSLWLLTVSGFADNNLYHKLIKDFYIENISAKEYKGSSQVWCIEKGEAQDIFLATGKGISVYDGVTWRNFGTKKTGITRWLAFDSKTKEIYAAVDNRFGVWTKNILGEYVYTNLHKNEDEQTSEIFWRTFILDESVYFQTQQKIYRYNKRTKDIDIIFTAGHIDYMHQLEQTIYLQSEGQLLKLVNDKFEKTGIAIENRIIGINLLANRITIATEDQGVFHIVDNRIEKIASPNNNQLVNSKLFATIQLSNNTLALGSVLDGLYIVDDKLNITEHINFAKNLKRTTVLSLLKDKEGNIWMGLDGGLARANRHPNEIVIQSRDSDIGTVYDATWFDNQLYIATNKGLFTYEKNNRLKFIAGSQGQVWNLKKIDNMLIVCHDSGLYKLNTHSNQLTKISSKAVWDLKQFNNDSKKFLSLDFKQTFSIYEKEEDNLVLKKEIEKTGGAHTSAYIDRYGYLWVQDRNYSPIRITLNTNDEIDNIKRYNLPAGVDSLHITEIDNDILFYSSKSAYLYDITYDSIIQTTHYSNMLKQMQTPILGIVQLGREDFFYASEKHIGQIKRIKNDFYNYGSIFKSLDKDLPLLAHRMMLLDENTIGTGVQEGLALYTTKNQNKEYNNKKTLEIAYLESLSRDSITLLPISSNEYTEVPSDYTNLRIYFRNMYQHGQIQYSIDNEDWILSNGIPYFKLKELAYGKHTIKFKNLNLNNEEGVSAAIIKIKIAHPWYRTPYFIITLTIAIILLCYLIQHIIKKRVQNQYEKIIEEQIRILKKEKNEHDLQILKIRLKEDEKNLVNLTMENVKRNSMLNEIRLDADIVNLTGADSKTLLKKLKNILKRIDYYLNNDDTQALFEKYFNEIHDGFYDKLLKSHPDLSKTEMKLCAYIKLNLNTKEIAAYMNIAPASVDVARYRLRKKLNLSQDINLQKYITDL